MSILNNMATHYICTGGCGGVSDKPGTCQATDCPKHGKPLQECHCQDNMHREGKEQEGLSNGADV